MRTLGIASVSVAALMALVVLDAKPADARGGGGRSFSASHTSTSARTVAHTSNKTFVKTVNKPSQTLRRATVHREPRLKHVAKIDKKIVGTGTSSAMLHKSGLGTGKLAFAKLPVVKAAAGNAHLVGRLNMPKNFKPKLTLAHAPKATSSCVLRRSCSGTGRRRSSGWRWRASAT